MNKITTALKRMGTIAGIIFLPSFLLLFAPVAYYWANNNRCKFLVDGEFFFPITEYSIITLSVSLFLAIPLFFINTSLHKLSYFYRFIAIYSLVALSSWAFAAFSGFDVEILLNYKLGGLSSIGNFIFCVLVLSIHAVHLVKSLGIGMLSGTLTLSGLLGLMAFNSYYLGFDHPGFSIVLFAGLSVSLLWQMLVYVRRKNKYAYWSLSIASCAILIVSGGFTYRLIGNAIERLELIEMYRSNAIRRAQLSGEDRSYEEAPTSDGYGMEEPYEEELDENEVLFDVWNDGDYPLQNDQAMGLSWEPIDASDFDSELSQSQDPFLVWDAIHHPKVNGRIRLPIDNGEVVVFADNPADNDSYTAFEYGGYLSNINKYMVFISTYESFACVLVDKSDGSYQRHHNVVRFNSEGSHMLVADVNPYEGLTTLYVYTSPEFNSVEYSEELEGCYRVEGAYWLDEHSFDIECRDYAEDNNEPYSRYIRVYMEQ